MNTYFTDQFKKAPNGGYVWHLMRTKDDNKAKCGQNLVSKNAFKHMTLNIHNAAPPFCAKCINKRPFRLIEARTIK